MNNYWAFASDVAGNDHDEQVGVQAEDHASAMVKAAREFKALGVLPWKIEIERA